MDNSTTWCFVPRIVSRECRIYFDPVCVPYRWHAARSQQVHHHDFVLMPTAVRKQHIDDPVVPPDVVASGGEFGAQMI